MKHKIIETTQGTFERVSGWIEVDLHQVRSDSELFCYAEEKEGEYGYVMGFTYKRKFYATASFYSLACMWVNEPFPTWTESGEKVRLYRKICG